MRDLLAKQPTHMAETSPDFSIIMANYNKGNFIESAIKSVLKQTYSNWELLICDDASTDDSINHINNYIDDPRIFLIQNDINKGIIYSENRLIMNCRADYIAILDSDDCISEDAVFHMLNAHINNPEATFIYSQYIYCDNKMNFVSKGTCNDIRKNSSLLVDDCAVAFRTFKKDAALNIGCLNNRMKYAEDKDFIYKLEEIGTTVFVEKDLYYYRVQDESSSQGYNRLLARVAMSYAKLEAYMRRLNSNIHNIGKEDISTEVLYALGASIRIQDWHKMKIFMTACLSHNLYILKNLGSFIKGLLGHILWL